MGFQEPDLIDQISSNVFDDYYAFVIFVVQMKLKTKPSLFIGQIDFEKGELSSEIRMKINDDYIVELIENCLKDQGSQLGEGFFRNRLFVPLN